MKSNIHVKFHSEALLEEMEARQLFSGGIEGFLVDDNELEPLYMDINSGQEQPEVADTLTMSTTDNMRQELVFIDTDVDNYQQLLNDILKQSDAERNIEVILLDNQRDGIEQITEALANYQNLDAVHLISHGSDGSVDIGNSQLDTEILKQNLLAISAWGDAFTENGDFLIYGCNLAATEDGQSLVQSLSSVTHTEVAASDDLTGHAELGGNWDLEYQVGVIEAQVIINPDLQLKWVGILDTTTGLVAHWAFDEGSGTTAIDSSGNNNTGTLTDSPTYTTGQVGSNALDFTSDFDRVVVADDASLSFGSGDFSVGFWFNSTFSGSVARLVGDMDGGDGYIFYTLGSGDVSFQVTSGGNSVVLSSNGLFDGTWHYIAGTRSGSDFSLYVDNQLADSTTNGLIGNIDNSNTLRIGASSASTNDYDGLIDEVRIYNRSLTSTDVTELFVDGGGGGGGEKGNTVGGGGGG